jgi:hypothetical protein
MILTRASRLVFIQKIGPEEIFMTGGMGSVLEDIRR